MEIDIVSIFKQRVSGVLNSPGIKFILFGSRSRGDADVFSDYDFLIITQEQKDNLSDKIEEIEEDIFSNYNAIINSHLFSEKELKKLSFEPFIINALREGIAA